MYILTKGWYSDMRVVGIVSEESEARDWEERDSTNSYSGPFEIGEILE